MVVCYAIGGSPMRGLEKYFRFSYNKVSFFMVFWIQRYWNYQSQKIQMTTLEGLSKVRYSFKWQEM